MSGRFEAVIGIVSDYAREMDRNIALTDDERTLVKQVLKDLERKLGTWEPAHTMMYVDDHVRFCNDLMDALRMERQYGTDVHTRGRMPTEAILHQVKSAAEAKRALLTLRKLWHEGA